MDGILHNLNVALGLDLDAKNLTFLQITLRGIIVFLTALLMVRLGDKRFLSQKTAFDAILGFILASVLARAVNGSSAFWPTLGGGFVLVFLHRLLAFSTRRWHFLGNLIKGTSDLVIQDGKIVESNLRKNDLSQDDLLEDLRLNGQVNHPEEVKVAYVERNGSVSAVKKQ